MSDLIDRQAAIEALMNASTPAFYKNGKPTFLVDYVSVMQNLPSAQPEHATCYLDSPCEYQNPKIKIPMPTAEPRWIPCSERLPEEVLCVTLVTDGIDVWAETWVGIRGKWKYNHSAITAWMPLPEPYEERREADEG